MSPHVAVLDEELAYPPNSGKRIRTWNLLTRAAKSARITVLAHRNTDRMEGEEAVEAYRQAGIETIVVPREVPPKSGAGFYARLAGNLLSPLPYSVESHTSRTMADAAIDLHERDPVDCWHVEWTPYAQVLKAALGPKLVRVPWVVTAHNVESVIWRRYAETEANPVKRWYVRRQETKFTSFEKWAYSSATRSIAVSEPDAELMRTGFDGREVDVIENGVDTAFFKPQRDLDRNPHQLLFLGSLDWRPNQDAVRLLIDVILPQLRKSHPQATLTIVGRNPPEWMTERVKSTSGISLAANVPDVRPYLAHCAAMVVPLRVGGGSRLKILEALATATPVVSTTIGAEGLNLKAGRHLTITNDIPGMAAAIAETLDDADTALRQADEGRRVVLRQYDWQPLAAKLIESWSAAKIEVETTPIEEEHADLEGS